MHYVKHVMWMCRIHAWQSRKKKGTPAASLLHPPPPSPLVGRHFTVGHPVFQAGRIVRAPASPGGRAARRQLLDGPHSLGFSPAGMAACASEWKWSCHSMWLFHPHSAVKIRPFPSAFPLVESIVKAFCWLLLEVPKK